MKRRIYVLAMACLAFALTSCLNQGDDSNVKPDYICMVNVTTGGVNPVFQMDGGSFLTPDATMPADTFQVGERYFIDFYLGDSTNHTPGTYPISLIRYNKTIVKNMIELQKDSVDLWGNKPIGNLYPSFSGHYFNAFFVSYAGLTTPNTFEFIRMKADEHTSPTDTVPNLSFHLRHNVESVATGMVYYRIYSFDVSSLTTEFPNAYKFKIKVSWDDANFGWSNYTQYYIPNQQITLPDLLSTNRKSIDLEPVSF
ncbi:MAG TPA: NigD-like C-terminal domain-containing protein [Bacteroidales bacterium]|nr:NigD-like C-terminal domain-containing protein [Bacteroidales bacterium]